MVRRKTNAFNPNILPFLLLSPALYPEHNTILSGIPLGSVGLHSCTPSLSAGEMGWGAQKVSALCKHCSMMRTALHYQLCLQHKSKAYSYCEENYPGQQQHSNWASFGPRKPGDHNCVQCQWVKESIQILSAAIPQMQSSRYRFGRICFFLL